MKLNGNDNGMVLVAVIVFAIAISIVSLAIIGANFSQASTAQERIDQIRAQEMAEGAYAKAYMDMISGVTTPTVVSEVMDGKTFNVSLSSSGDAPYRVTVNY